LGLAIETVKLFKKNHCPRKARKTRTKNFLNQLNLMNCFFVLFVFFVDKKLLRCFFRILSQSLSFYPAYKFP